MNFRSPALRSVFSTRLPVMAKATCIPRWQLSRTTLRIWDLRHRRREKQWVKLSSWIRLIWLMPQEFMWHQINPLKKKTSNASTCLLFSKAFHFSSFLRAPGHPSPTQIPGAPRAEVIHDVFDDVTGGGIHRNHRGPR
jgi:hypothetical protein